MKQISETKQVTSVNIFYMRKDAWRKNIESDTLKMISGQHTVDSLKSDGLKEFTSVSEFTMDSSGNLETDAEKLFMLFNDDYQNPLGTPDGQSHLRSVGSGHTSMSVGDFILFDNKTILVVLDGGWEKVPIEDVKT